MVIILALLERGLEAKTVMATTVAQAMDQAMAQTMEPVAILEGTPVVARAAEDPEAVEDPEIVTVQAAVVILVQELAAVQAAAVELEQVVLPTALAANLVEAQTAEVETVEPADQNKC